MFQFNINMIANLPVFKVFAKLYQPGTFWLTRIVFLRSLGFIYTVAFSIAINQNNQLLGDDGLLPASLYMRNMETDYKTLWAKFYNMPTLLWFVGQENIGFCMQLIPSIGLAISVVVLITGSANLVAMFLLWLLYHSIVNVGQQWYSFGWESQLLETGFLAIFLCPLTSWFPSNTPPSKVVIWALRWLLFRIMIGAGMIKIRGDACWRDLTCMNYHYQTQPVPNPVSYYLHQLPPFMHKIETLGNHIIELGVPWFLFLPNPFPCVCGIAQIFFQMVLIISGNLSFLNWLTILPAIAYFNDQNLRWVFPNSTVKLYNSIEQEYRNSKLKVPRVRKYLNIALALLLIFLSTPVVLNLFSARQVMNTSYDPFRIVNTYGAFGAVTKKRTEIILKGTQSTNINNAVWEEYEFKCKPGNTSRAPCLISPYHYRLDWLMWFAAFQDYRYNPWLVHLVGFLLQNDPEVSSLMAKNPFHDRDPPRYIKADHYAYTFTKLGNVAANKGHWWKRKLIKDYLPPMTLEMLEPIYKQFDWDIIKNTQKTSQKEKR